MKHSVFYLFVLFTILILGCKADIKPTNDHLGEDDAYVVNKLPPFPLPFPKPSTLHKLPRVAFEKCVTLGNIDKRLSEALDSCNYYRKSYFSIPNGFALVTQLEKFNEDGSTLPDDERWVDINSSKFFSIFEYIKSLFIARTGHYRCIVFLVTDEILKSRTDTVKSQEVQDWLGDGEVKLSKQLLEKEINENYDVVALIYEFEKLENPEEVNFITDSNLPGKLHLTNANILANLDQDN